ncbi:UDP-N-acetylmuramoyl-L-alanyl-D-glutamate--2,6-diaminopimelate ligase [Nigerium massiliense]
MPSNSQVGRPAQAPGLALSELVPGASGTIGGITLDSRHVLPGDLYVGLPGERTHGGRFAASAADAGAVAVLTDGAGRGLAGDLEIPVVVVDDPRAAMAPIAARIYGEPTARALTLGVTGTNGKTSTVFLVEAALTALGRVPATVGTIGFRVGGEPLDVDRSTVTTPESPDLQALLAVMGERGADAFAMEVSSHALALHRVDGITFDVAAFTMLGQDHLDFHHTMENYFAAKASLFLGGRSRAAVVNIDDPWGRRLAGLVRDDGHARLVTTAVEREADYRIVASETHADGSADVRLATPNGEVAFGLTMLGDFNARNALTALAMVGAAGLDVRAAAAGLRGAQVPGRMQRVDLPDGSPNVVVDFGHTPQAVEAALSALPRTGRVIAVLGAGGDRDATKRGPMGAAAARQADVVVVTDDNPRSEDPATIRAAVLQGAREQADAGTEVVDGGDRRGAIARALRLTGPGDWVAVLGKGHERGQDVAGVISPFDDVAVVRELVRGGE